MSIHLFESIPQGDVPRNPRKGKEARGTTLTEDTATKDDTLTEGDTLTEEDALIEGETLTKEDGLTEGDTLMEGGTL